MTHQAILQTTAKSYDTNTDLLEILSKVGSLHVCFMRNSGQMTIGKTDPTLVKKLTVTSDEA